MDTSQRALLYAEVSEFVYNEAALLDTRQFREWLDLLSDDVVYQAPMQLNVEFGEDQRAQTQPGSEICWFDESKETLSQRVAQIETGVHWADEPASRVSYLVSNVRMTDVELPRVGVSSRFLLYRNRLYGEVDLFVGKREDVLTKTDLGWRVAKRHVLLDQTVLLAKNLTILF